MASDRLPWFPFFVVDWRMDAHVRSLTPEQRGHYIDLLALQWWEGWVPGESNLAAQVLGVESDGSLSQVLHRFFPADPDNPTRRQNPRLEEIRSTQERRQKGLKLGAAKTNKRKKLHARRTAKRTLGVTPSARESESEIDLESRNLSPSLDGIGSQESTQDNPPRKNLSLAGARNGSAGKVAKASPGKPNWVAQAIDDYDELWGKGSGNVQAGKIGRALKPLVVAHTWEHVQQAWRRYLRESDRQYQSPANFAGHFADWAVVPFEGLRREFLDDAGAFVLKVYRGGKWARDA